MKRIMIILLLCIFLVSCSKNHSSDEYFLHAIGFSEDKGKLILQAVCEKQSDQEKDYFLIKKTGKNLESVTKDIRKKYKNCYFATTEIYLFSSSLSHSTKKKLAADLITSNLYPTKSKGITIDNKSYQSTLEKIKTEDDLKKLLYDNEKSDNLAKHLAQFLEERVYAD